MNAIFQNLNWQYTKPRNSVIWIWCSLKLYKKLKKPWEIIDINCRRITFTQVPQLIYSKLLEKLFLKILNKRNWNCYLFGLPYNRTSYDPYVFIQIRSPALVQPVQISQTVKNMESVELAQSFAFTWLRKRAWRSKKMLNANDNKSNSDVEENLFY